MKNLIGMLFNREPPLNYVIAEYKPNREYAAIMQAKIAEYEVDEPEASDEMEIDNLYQRN